LRTSYFLFRIIVNVVATRPHNQPSMFNLGVGNGLLALLTLDADNRLLKIQELTMFARQRWLTIRQIASQKLGNPDLYHSVRRTLMDDPNGRTSHWQEEQAPYLSRVVRG